MAAKAHAQELQALLAGCDPETGEVLDQRTREVLERPSVKDALQAAVGALTRGTRVPPPFYPVPEGHPLDGRSFLGERPRDIASDLKADFPDHIVFVQEGYFWSAYEDDAYRCAELLGWKVGSRGTSYCFTGTPIWARRFKEKLAEAGISFILVRQTEYPSSHDVVEREVYEICTTQDPVAG